MFDGFRMTQRIMLFPSEKFDAYLDMLITSINSLLDYIEMRFGYLMLKHIEGKVSREMQAKKSHHQNLCCDR